MIVVENLTVHAGNFCLEEVSFEIPSGGYCALMGKTGSGKTTLLEAICGLKHVSAGRILLDDVDVTHLKPAERNLGFVPQDGALFSSMTVFEQLAFSLVIRRASKSVIQKRVDELANLLDIGHLLDRTIVGLSGGEKQRIALGRALAFGPSTLCLDEPLSALDDDTRKQMYVLLEHVRKQTGVTTLHVTHNIDEAVRLADHVFRVENGHVIRQEPNGLNGSNSNGHSQPDSSPSPKPSPQDHA